MEEQGKYFLLSFGGLKFYKSAASISDLKTTKSFQNQEELQVNAIFFQCIVKFQTIRQIFFKTERKKKKINQRLNKHLS